MPLTRGSPKRPTPWLCECPLRTSSLLWSSSWWNREAKPRAGTDFKDLPFDLLSPILSELSTPRDLCACALVDKTFNRAVTPLLYRSIHVGMVSRVSIADVLQQEWICDWMKLLRASTMSVILLKHWSNDRNLQDTCKKSLRMVRPLPMLLNAFSVV